MKGCAEVLLGKTVPVLNYSRFILCIYIMCIYIIYVYIYIYYVYIYSVYYIYIICIHIQYIYREREIETIQEYVHRMPPLIQTNSSLLRVCLDLVAVSSKRRAVQTPRNHLMSQGLVVLLGSASRSVSVCVSHRKSSLKPCDSKLQKEQTKKT